MEDEQRFPTREGPATERQDLEAEEHVMGDRAPG